MCVFVAYRQSDMKGCGHPAQDGWVKILWSVGGTHHHHLGVRHFRVEQPPLITA